MVTADGWYSGVASLPFLKKKEPGFLIALEKNRAASEQAQRVRGRGGSGLARKCKGRAPARVGLCGRG